VGGTATLSGIISTLSAITFGDDVWLPGASTADTASNDAAGPDDAVEAVPTSAVSYWVVNVGGNRYAIALYQISATA